jgi:hypothetical protein
MLAFRPACWQKGAAITWEPPTLTFALSANRRLSSSSVQRASILHVAPPMALRNALFAWGAAVSVLGAAGYERVRDFTAQELLTTAEIKGPHHQVAKAVPTDGYLHVFNVTTDWGEVEAEGLSQLRVRLDEVRALAELDDVSKSEVFLQSAGGAVLNVGKGVGAVVTKPGETAEGLGKGLKRFGTNLGRKAKRASDEVTSSDEEKQEGASKSGQKTASAAGGVASSVLGVSGSARKWAQKVGADPYTTNPVLRKALSDIGKIDAAGSIATKVVLPMPPVVSATAGVGGLVWSQDPEALLKQNEAQLRALGVSDQVIKQLYLSKGFSLTLHTRLAQALSAVRAEGAAAYVASAAEADTEREALFFVESAEMLRRLHAATPVVALLADSRALVAKTGDARAVVLAPVDWVQWTEPFAKAAAEVAARARKELGATKLELHLTGSASAVAKKQAAALGWSVVERVT